MAIALTLTLVAFISALFITEPKVVIEAWSKGLWDADLMRFGFQAMFMLVLGHVLALSKPVRSALDGVANFAVSDDIAKSHDATNWHPAAVAIPSTSAITGFGD